MRIHDVWDQLVAMAMISDRILDKLWVEPTEFPDGLHVGCERKKSSRMTLKDFDLSSLKEGVAIN